MTDYSEFIESASSQPYWIIDILPGQVPAARRQQYFEAEKHFTQEPQLSAIHRQFSNLMVKLGCYLDLVVVDDECLTVEGPLPAALARMFASRRPFSMIIEHNVLLTYGGDDHYMTLYAPTPASLPHLTALAAAQGLFLWRPPC